MIDAQCCRWTQSSRLAASKRVAAINSVTVRTRALQAGSGTRARQTTVTMAAKQRVFPFSRGRSDGDRSMKDLLGGKGANLCEMARIGLNVPPGMVITTDVCQQFYASGRRLPEGLMEEVRQALHDVERLMGQRFGDPANPLLLSVRSGAAASMPGMMDTVLNLGLNDEVVAGLAARHGQRFAYDCHRRLLQMFGDVVLGIPHASFERHLAELKAQRGTKFDIDLTSDDLQALVKRFKAVYEEHGQSLPQDPWRQLEDGVAAVFRSWNTPRAVKYRQITRLTGLRGTAVNVQAMVFGNVGPTSGTGVCFTRNPAQGTKELFGEYLINAQGEDVVAGIRTPQPIYTMAQALHQAYADLVDSTNRLEAHMHNMQDCEFTVQEGHLFMLQTRDGKRTGLAALRVALDMVSEGLITAEEAILMVEPRHLDQMLHPTFVRDAKDMATDVVARGLPASPGAAVGQLVFTAEAAEAWKSDGKQVVLMREETSAEDVGGMHAAEAVVTAHGGMTSHAAVVARGWGKPCICGCEVLRVDTAAKTAVVVAMPGGGGEGSSTAASYGESSGGAESHTKPHAAAGLKTVTLKEGDFVSVNGTTGELILGRQPLREPAIVGDLATFMSWADKARRLRVLANADTPDDVAVAIKNGAQGVGLCRTEHMFFSSPERISAMRRMIVAQALRSPAAAAALADLQSYQVSDFESIFRAAAGLPVTIRLLDPPLHEFLPKAGEALEELVAKLSSELGQPPDAVRRQLEGLHEANPMMGLRGCRLGIVHPSVSRMQVAAVFQAAAKVAAQGMVVKPAIMVPLVGVAEELRNQVELVHSVAAEVLGRTNALQQQQASAAADSLTVMNARKEKASDKIGNGVRTSGATALQHGAVAAGGGGPGIISSNAAPAAAAAAAAAATAASATAAAAFDYEVGTMIEVPRGALRAGDLAPLVSFFSYGTNDLTQMTFGISRDDAEASFLSQYVKEGILPADPFQVLDRDGVGELVALGAARGRAANPLLDVGVCGEHGGDPASIAFFEEQGLDYVSCSPLRVPVARLAAAQAALKLAAKKKSDKSNGQESAAAAASGVAAAPSPASS